MPAPSPSPAVIRAAATVARDTGCVVEIEKATGNIRILPPTDKPAHPAHGPKSW